MGPQSDFGRTKVSREDGEQNCAPREPLNAISRLRKVPPGPFRSLGKYLDYEGWPGCQRFMELDEAIRCEVQDGRSHESRADGYNPEDEAPEVLAAAEAGCRSRSRFRPAARVGKVRDDDRPRPSMGEIARALDAPRLRRL